MMPTQKKKEEDKVAMENVMKIAHHIKNQEMNTKEGSRVTGREKKEKENSN